MLFNRIIPLYVRCETTARVSVLHGDFAVWLLAVLVDSADFVFNVLDVFVALAVLAVLPVFVC